ncbi:MAG: hypothetical protein UU98_C0001G0036 [Parcubacteria group bacterium GW2011_GWD2_42_14]|nr:MAG: hypothetical protein UU98_C0001G0036 [Parcubacteria group bacterium GW2011_GWD2_42_14]
MNTQTKIFLKNSLLFTGLVLVIFLLINSLYIHKIEKRKQVYRKEYQWQEFSNTLPQGTLDYAFFGDSHADRALNPEFVPNSFNFAGSGESYTETYYKVKKLIENDNVNINTIVLEIDLQIFSDKKGLPFSALRYFSTFVPLSEIADMRGENELALYLKKGFIVFGKGNEIISYLLKQNNETPVSLGWVKTDGDFSNFTNKSKSAFESFEAEFSNEPNLIEEDGFNYFLKILQIAEDNNINIIFIMYPVSYEYDLEIQKHFIVREVYYKKLFDLIDDVVTKYDVLDYYKLFFEEPEKFTDADHLNYVGAESFSKIVAKDLEKISEKQNKD